MRKDVKMSKVMYSKDWFIDNESFIKEQSKKYEAVSNMVSPLYSLERNNIPWGDNRYV